MSTRRSRLVYATVLVASVAVLAGGLTRYVTRPNSSTAVPAAPEPRPLAPSSSAVTLTVSLLANQAALGSHVAVVVEAVGPVTAVEFWDGGVRAGSVETDATKSGRRAEFTWTPMRPGAHLLVGRAVESPTTVSMSAPVSVGVFIGPDASSATVPFVVPAGPGVTIATIAAQAGVTTDKVTVAPDGSAFAVDKFAAVKAQNENLTPIESPVTPGASGSALAATTKGCSVTVRGPVGSGSELVIYEASGTGTGFHEVGKGGSLTVNDLGPGAHSFVAGPAGQPPTTPPVSVVLPPSCKQSWWTGDATLVDGIVTVPKPGPNLYIYLGVDTQPFVRIPAEPNTYLPGVTSHIDISGMLPAISGKKVRLEVWAAGNPSVKVANGSATVPDGKTIIDLIGESTATRVTTTVKQVDPKTDSIEFSWATRNTHADAIFWQILNRPISDNEETLAPAGLIATGIALAKAAPAGVLPGAVGGGTFSISPSVFLPKNTTQAVSFVLSPTLKLADFDLRTPAPVARSDVNPSLIVSDANPVLLGDRIWIRVVPIAKVQPLGASSPAISLAKPPPPNPPIANMNVVGSVLYPGRGGNDTLAGCIRVTKVPWTPQEVTNALVSSRGSIFNPPAGGISTPAGVGGIDTSPPGNDGVDRSGWLWVAPFYPTPGTYCPADFPPPPPDDGGGGCGLNPVCYGEKGFDAVAGGLNAAIKWTVETIGPIWDYVAKAYNGLIDLAAKVAGTLNPFCLQARAAAKVSGSATLDSAADECTKYATIASKAAIGAVLAAYGLPPSLPTTEQLKAIAAGRLEDLAVELMKDLGVPCDDLVVDADVAGPIGNQTGYDVPPEGVDICRAMVKKVMGAIKDKAKVAVQQQVGATTGMPSPSSAIAGFDMIIEPRQSYRGPTAGVSTTPVDPKVPKNAVCPIAINVQPTFAPADGLITFHEGGSTTTVGTDLFGNDLPQVTETFEPWWGTAVGIAPVVDIDAGHLVSAIITSPNGCLTPATTKVLDLVKPPLGRWSPGQSD